MRSAALCAFLATSVALASFASAEQLYATNGANLLDFNSNNPGNVTSTPISGMQTGEILLGMDVSPANGAIYGIGNTSRLYSIATNGTATQIGTSGQFTLNGTSFGIDFDPVNPGPLRIVSNTGQNLRIDSSNGTAVTDTLLNTTGSIVGIAYDNNVSGALSSTLFAIDAVSGFYEVITTPNNGGPIVPIGSLGLGTNLNLGIAHDVSGVTGIHYAAITIGTQYNLYVVNPTTAATTFLGAIGTGTYGLKGLAVAPVPEPASGVLALGAALAVMCARRSGGKQRTRQDSNLRPLD